MKKYLILTASYGTGHNTAKEAIKSELIKKGNIVESIDLVDFLRFNGGKSSKKFYEISESFPILWDTMFNILDKKFSNDLLDIFVQTTVQQKFNKYLQKYKPDFIICTFPNWPIFIKNYISKYKKTFKTAIVVTDSIEIGMPWFFGYEAIDYFFVIDEYSKEVFKNKFKHKKKNVYVSFFPLDEKYFLTKKSIKVKNIVLLLSGLKKDFVLDFLQRIKEEDFYENITVIKGRNAKLFSLLQKKMKIPKIKYIDFINLKDNFKNIDIFIAKPGGAVMCECIAQDVVMISPSFIPGQEEGNIKFMNKAGVGIYEEDPEKVIFHLKYTDFNRFLPNFKKVKNKNSIKFILDKVVN